MSLIAAEEIAREKALRESEKLIAYSHQRDTLVPSGIKIHQVYDEGQMKLRLKGPGPLSMDIKIGGSRETPQTKD